MKCKFTSNIFWFQLYLSIKICNYLLSRGNNQLKRVFHRNLKRFIYEDKLSQLFVRSDCILNFRVKQYLNKKNVHTITALRFWKQHKFIKHLFFYIIFFLKLIFILKIS